MLCSTRMTITLHPRRMRWVLFGIVIFLSFAHAIGSAFTYYTGHDQVFGLIPQFALGLENNFPTWFSSLLHLIAATLLFVITAEERSHRGRHLREWRFLGFVFLGLSIDEAASLHEMLDRPTKLLVENRGALYYAWVIPAIIFVGVLAIAYRQWLRALPERTRRLSIFAAFLFVGGAVGFEMLESLHMASGGAFTSHHMKAMMLVEETMEMCGVVVWIFALSEYLQINGYAFSVTFSSDSGRENSASKAAD